MSRTRSVFLPSVALLVVAGSVPASAQQRVDVTTTRPRQQSELEAPVRRLRAQLDSLAQRYSDEEITLVDRRRIETEIARVVERLQEAMDHAGPEMKARVMLRAPSAQTLLAPRGWIGIVVEGPGMEPRIENGELVVRYLSYPRIVSVDPSSPAQVAGIIPNDTLLAYDGRDVRENDINLNKLLKPASRVNVKLRRDGKTREVPVVIAETPSRIALRRSDEARSELMPAMPSGEGMIIRMPMPPQGGMARGSTVRLAPSAPNAPTAVATGAPMFSFSLGANGVAGASLVTITEGLAKRFGVSNGVLVTVVPQGSPAAQSGLEDGDVIVRISNSAVRTVNDVRRAVGQAWENGQRSVDLELLRDNKTVKLALRW